MVYDCTSLYKVCFFREPLSYWADRYFTGVPVILSASSSGYPLHYHLGLALHPPYPYYPPLRPCYPPASLWYETVCTFFMVSIIGPYGAAKTAQASLVLPPTSWWLHLYRTAGNGVLPLKR